MPTPSSTNQHALEQLVPVGANAESTENALLTPAGAANVIRFLECVRSIVSGLLAQGYTLRDGHLVPPIEEDQKARPGLDLRMP